MPRDLAPGADEIGAPELRKPVATTCTCVVQVRAHQTHILVPDPHCPKHKETQ